MYGFLICLGAFAAFLISENTAKKRNLNLKLFYRTFNIAFILGLVSARLYHVIDYWSLYKTNPILIPQVWKGGMGIYGAFAGGLAGVFLSLKVFNKQKVNLLKWLDITVLGLPLAQALGRWGNFFNKELYGMESSLPWAIEIKGKTYHPLFLYESILNLILFVILWKLNKTQKKLTAGKIFYTYLAGYGLTRFALEFLRLRSWTIYGINVAQAISLLLIIIGLQGLSFMQFKLYTSGKVKNSKSIKDNPSK